MQLDKLVKSNNYIEEYAMINGIEQFLLHMKTIDDLPLALFLHGGPGQSESMFSYLFEDQFAELCTMVYWDQRGAGRTFSKNKKEKPTAEILLDDLFNVVQFLKEKYNKEKVIIIGHSWGTVLGTMFLRKYPNEVLFYIGVGQAINMFENEKVGFLKLKEEIIKANNKRDLRKLKKLGNYPENNFEKPMLKKMVKKSFLLAKYDLGIKINWKLIKTSIKSPFFRIEDIFIYLNSMSHSEDIMRQINDYNLYEQSFVYPMGIYYILGDRDFQTPYTIACKYFEKIEAPHKKLYVFEGAGHNTLIDKPEEFINALNEIWRIEGIR